MFGKRITLFKLLGFAVRVDATWLILAVLVTWTLAAGVFPNYYPALSTTTHWLMGVLGTLGLFFSIVFHEFSHSIVARQYKLPITGITLFLFGGVAEMKDEPENAKSEFMMAIAGPIASVVLAVVFYVAYLVLKAGGSEIVAGVLTYLATINVILAIFNMVPAFPLDGGRVLRSILWGWKGDIRWATRLSARIGGMFGILLIVLGVVSVVQGNFIGGMWWFLIGLFIRGAANMAYQQILVRQGFEGVPIRRLMNEKPVTVAPSLSVRDLIEDYIYKHHFKMFPVVDDSKLLGCVTVQDVKNVPKERWANTTVRDIMGGCAETNTVRPDEDASKVLRRMTGEGGSSRFLVAEGDRLVGLVSMRDMMEYLSLKFELEEGEKPKVPMAPDLGGDDQLSRRPSQ